MPPCRVFSISKLLPYVDALTWQYDLVRARQGQEIPDTLLLLEHPPTITLGRGSAETDIFTSEEELTRRGVTVEHVDRGGEITYHAPGQLVGYPILDLRQHGQDLHRYLRDLEEVIILSLAHYGLKGERITGLTGVWVNAKKIAAIGIKVSRWVSMHGFALNIDIGLTPFRRDLVPCGIRDRDVTSLAELLPGEYPTRGEVEATLLKSFARVFEMSLTFTEDLGILPK